MAEKPADPVMAHAAHWGDHNDYACQFSGPHCWACNEPWPCRASRGVAVADAEPDMPQEQESGW